MNEKDLHPDHLNGIYREIATLLSCEAALALHHAFRGQQISFPVEVLSREYIAEQIRKEYNGFNIKELASKFGYTEKWIRHILKTEANV